MHKKPLVAVLILGLLLLTPALGFAAKAPVPGMLSEQSVELLPRIARQLDKPAPGAPTPVTGTSEQINLGVSRSGATYCDNEWQWEGAGAVFFGAWFFGDEFYAAWQDPEDLVYGGTCAGGSDIYTFDVTGIAWWVFNQINPAALNFDAQPLVYDNATDQICPVPGNVLCAGPLYAVSITSAAPTLYLPFPTECCVYGPYFAGVYVPTTLGTGLLGIIAANPAAGVGTAPSCRMYNEYGTGWVDLGPIFGRNLELWSDGIAFDQNNCPGTPGVCDWQYWTDGTVVNLWNDPNANGQTDYYVRFDATVSCTLEKARLFLYSPSMVGTPTLRVRVYGNNGPIFGGLLYPDAAIEGANFLGFVDVPFASFVYFPAFLEVDLTSLGPLVFGPNENFFISASKSPVSAPTDVISFLSDTPTGGGLGGDPRSGSWVGVLSDYYYFGEVFASGQRELYIEAFICCEVVELVEDACPTAGPDDWSTWAHDYQRTSASTIELGDPCQVTAEWYQPLNALAQFTDVTVANDRVYANTDNRLRVYDLATGAPGNFIAGIPHIFGSNRGNNTIHGSSVYVTGGTARSIGKWNLDLSVNSWVNGLTTTPLSGDVRFGVTAVYDVGGTEVVVVGDDNQRLYCFETATGALFGGWATNPRILTGAALHSPAYDGVGTLYVGTALTTLISGTIYSIDAATGAINWTYDDPNLADEGYPGGVSYEGGFIFANSNSGTASGRRVKLTSAGAEVWNFSNGRSLYSAPTIGRNFLYISQDGGGTGIIAVDKGSGTALYNFALDGVGQVTQHNTLLCDNFLFAGDRSGKWWLLNANTFTDEWYFQFFGIVNGTAVATHSGGDDFAVVSIRQDAAPGLGGLAAFKLNVADRPRLRQDVFLTEFLVPFGTGPGNPYTEPGVLANVGCSDLNVLGTNVYDPLPDVSASTFTRTQERYAEAMASVTVGPDYTAYFDINSMTKKQRVAYNKVLPMVDVELTRFDAEAVSAQHAIKQSNTTQNRMAAGAAIVRTSNVTTNDPTPPGGSLNVSWLWDGTALERGYDVEFIEIITDDPDYAAIPGHEPLLQIDYVGGCPSEVADIEWNTLGAANSEEIYNTGAMGNDDNDSDLDWDGAHPNYDAAFYLAGDSSQATGGAQFHTGAAYDFAAHSRLFLPNPLASLGGCGIESHTDVDLGYKRTGGCPGTPELIQGAWVRSAYIDTNEALAGTPREAIGTIITQTEVGAYDPVYGDFKLIRWEILNRDAVAKGPIYAGTMYDWDVDDYAENHGIVSANFNGYAIWDWDAPSLAFGMLDPNQPSSYTGVDPTAFPPRVIREAGQLIAYDEWQAGGAGGPLPNLWHLVVNRAPLYESGGHETGLQEDHQGYLTNGAIFLDPNGSAAVHQALFAVDATSGAAAVEASAIELAARAAKWGGFARGDVNDDGVINLADVCWLLSGNQIYPDTYNGDVDLSGGVDAADESYLLNYVTGLGPGPQGEWRFTF